MRVMVLMMLVMKTATAEYEGDDEVYEDEEEDDEDDEEFEEDGGAMMGFATMQLPPSVVVTIMGTTSHRQGQILLTRVLETWLAKHAERPDRPYRIIPVGSDQGLSIRPFSDTPGAGEMGRRNTNAGLIGRGPGTSRNPRATARTSGRRAPGRPVGGAAGGQPTSIEDILPSHPLASEPRDNDWKFQIVWRFELKRPDDARTTDDVPMGVDESDGVPTDADLAMENGA